MDALNKETADMVKSLGLDKAAKAPQKKGGKGSAQAKREPKKAPPRAMVVPSLSSKASQKSAKKEGGASSTSGAPRPNRPHEKPSAPVLKNKQTKEATKEAGSAQKKDSKKDSFDPKKYKTGPKPFFAVTPPTAEKSKVDHSQHKKSWWFTFERASKKPLISMEGVEKWYEISQGDAQGGDTDEPTGEPTDTPVEVKRLDAGALISLQVRG